MNETMTWCIAVFLVVFAVAADGYLLLMSIRGWHESRSQRLIRHAKWSRRKSSASSATSAGPAKDSAAPTSNRYILFACSVLATVGMCTMFAAAQSTESQREPANVVQYAVSVQLNLDVTSAYYYRGIRQQDHGLLVQPTARATVSLKNDTDFKIDGFIGTWNSFGPNGGTRTGALIEDWYESDLYAGFTLTHDKLSLTTSYTFLTSPSDAFQSVQELGFTLALDDSDWLKSWAIKPYATLVFEIGANGSDGADLDNGTYLEIGIAPGFMLEVDNTPITITFPASIGLSLSDYYQDAGGNDTTLGFAQIGMKVAMPLGAPGLVGHYGQQTLNAGVAIMFLGDHTKAYNNGDASEIVGTLGLQWNF